MDMDQKDTAHQRGVECLDMLGGSWTQKAKKRALKTKNTYADTDFFLLATRDLVGFRAAEFYEVEPRARGWGAHDGGAAHASGTLDCGAVGATQVGGTRVGLDSNSACCSGRVELVDQNHI